MNEKALNVLEYHKIIGMLSGMAGCEMSRRICEALVPMDDIDDIRMGLRSTAEAVGLIVHKGPLPTDGLFDVSGAVSLASKGGTLTTRQLLEIKNDLQIASRVKSFLKGDIPEIPLIMELADLIVPHQKLEDEINRCILTEDEIADSASSELRRIRSEIRRKNDDLKIRLEKIIGGTENRNYLQDAIVTIRDGRYVIPVKAEHRQKFPGIVHDQSRGGQTLFVEPQVIVEMNNALKELMLAEENEIARILLKLSEHVGECRHDIRNNQDLMTKLDFYMAKGKLACAMKAEEPIISEEGVLELKQARHPLLDKETCVPVTVSLGKDYRTLIITGPNTGGKTLTLKTIGLLSMMAASGLHIPASSTSVIPVYDDIFADIGDEQSIEQSLSTFSSHMKNIVEIVSRANSRTLVLLDELGAGTDPTEGAALGIAILEELYSRGAYTAATTHYNELKKFALSREGVENASMEFDVETLSPTYRLLTGTPGRSNAFEISRKLGLPNGIIERAGVIIDRGEAEFEDLIASIDQDRHRAENDRMEAASLLEKTRLDRLKLEQDAEKLIREREKILADARQQARGILKDAQDTADEVREELKALARKDSLGERNRDYSETKRKLREKTEQYSEKIVSRVNSAPVPASEVKAGDTVRILSLGLTGTVIDPPDDKDEVKIRAGVIKTTVKLDDIELLNDGSKQANKKKTISSRPGTSIARSKAMSVKSSLDVRGQDLDNARMDVEKYLDDVSMSGLREVTVIHGRGEGILRNGIRKMLKTNKHVASFRNGVHNEGGDGVTIVVLKEK